MRLLGGDAMSGETSEVRYKQKQVISRVVGNELVLYEEQTHTAHCLNEFAREIWLTCEGGRSATQVLYALRSQYPTIGEDSIAGALNALVSAGLLKVTPMAEDISHSRRQAVRKIITAAAMLPVITSISVPPASAAKSPAHGTSRTRPRTARGGTTE
jgi:hypothetical protein